MTIIELKRYWVWVWFVAFGLLTTAAGVAQPLAPGGPLAGQVQAEERSLPGLPAGLWTENRGQWPAWMQYRLQQRGVEAYADGSTTRFLLYDPEISHEIHHDRYANLTFQAHAYTVELVGANARPPAQPQQPQPNVANYFLGQDPSRWASDVQSFAQVVYPDVYPDIDYHLLSNGSQVKTEYHVAPGANAMDVQLLYRGVKPQIRATPAGTELVYETVLGLVIEGTPWAYQLVGGDTVTVPCQYAVRGDTVSFVFPAGYDPTFALVIDPVMVFSTFSGSVADNWGFCATFDLGGNLYAGGVVNAFQFGFDTFPTVGPVQAVYGGGGPFYGSGTGDASVFYPSDMAIIKYNATGTQIVYSTYLGGFDNEQPHSLITNNQGELYIFGTTRSSNFPSTPGAFDPTFNGNIDIVVSRLSAAGNQLLGSTFVGGSGQDGINLTNVVNNVQQNPINLFYGDDARGEIILDDTGAVYIATATSSANFPTTANAVRPLFTSPTDVLDGVFFKLDSSLSALRYSTRVGGNGFDAAYSIAINPNANQAYVAGATTSSPFMGGLTTGTWSTYQGGQSDGFIALFNMASGNLLASTYIGTGGIDQAYFVRTDRDGNVHAAGVCGAGFPVSTGVYTNPGSRQYFIKLSPDLQTRLISTVWGSGRSTPDVTLTAFTVDFCGSIYASGWGGLNNVGGLRGNTSGLPTTPDAVKLATDGADLYMIVLGNNANALLYGSFFGINGVQEHVDAGSSRFDANGIIYQTVCGGCGGNPGFTVTTPNAWSTFNQSSNCNMLSYKLDFQLISAVLANYQPTRTDYCLDEMPIQFQNTSAGALTLAWDFGDGTQSTAPNPSHSFASPGSYTVRLIATNPNSCNRNDTIERTFRIVDRVAPAFTVEDNDCGQTVRFLNNSPNLSVAQFRWDFGDGNQSADINPVHTYATPGNYTIRLYANEGFLCVDSALQTVTVSPPPVASFVVQNTVCQLGITCQDGSVTARSWAWDFGDGTTSTLQNPTHTYAQTGTYTIRLIINAGTNCPDTLVRIADIAAISVAQFGFTEPDCDRFVQFNDSSQYARDWAWDFGDGTQSTQPNPSHTYAQGGTYTVRLITNPGTACADTLTRQVLVPEFPTAGFTIDYSPCSYSVSLLNTSTNATDFLWDLGDGTQSTLTNPAHTYAQGGTYTLRLTAAPNSPCPEVWEETLILIGPTEARFALPDTACSLTVSLDNQSINAIDYRWDLGDGTQSTQANPTHTYAQGGNYTVTLITDPSGTCPDTLSRLLYIPTLVQAALDTSRERCALTIDFDASLSSAGASQFTWDFGDGSAPRTTAGPTTQHTYRRRGTYAVTLTVNADSTCPSVFTIPAVAAGSDVFADFTSPNVLCDSMFAPANTTTGPATDYLWDMGDGTTSTLPNPTHRYAQPGTYTIRLIAEPGTLCADTAVRTVRVSETPRADFEILQEACGGLLTLTDRSSGPVATRRWLLPEGQRPTDAVVTTTFGFSQVARLSLVVTDSLGCADTATVDYRYDPTGLSYLHIPNVFTPNGDGVNDRFEIKGLSNQCLTECVIYDRWGAVSYRTTDPGLNWDGTVGGVPAAEGVYVYVLLIDGKAHRVGTVTLLR